MFSSQLELSYHENVPKRVFHLNVLTQVKDSQVATYLAFENNKRLTKLRKTDKKLFDTTTLRLQVILVLLNLCLFFIEVKGSVVEVATGQLSLILLGN